MEIYLVGGAVRDTLLQRPVTERDWVVVGATPQQMLDKGFKQVGKDFPVFLHPDTQEEYALARTERKQGHGYHGFTVYAAPDVTLEDDLIRRDLTINAMAMDQRGNIIDPYNGQVDLAKKQLRHVSEQFTEDPLRVLRVARFAARYHPLAFTIAPETLSLMQTIVEQGELNHLTPERVWKEMERALSEPSPSLFFESLRACGALGVLLPELDRLFGIPQRPEYHPEIDCGIHTMMSLEQAALLTKDTEVRFAVLCHDLGKGLTPADVLPRHIGHEKKSIALIEAIAARFKIPNDHKRLAVQVAEFHTHCHRVMELTPKKLLALIQTLDSFRRPEQLEKFIIACEADARGRTGFEKRDYPQAAYLREAFQRVVAIGSQSVDLSQFKGRAVGEEIRRQRLAALTKFRSSNSKR